MKFSIPKFETFLSEQAETTETLSLRKQIEDKKTERAKKMQEIANIDTTISTLEKNIIALKGKIAADQSKQPQPGAEKTTESYHGEEPIEEDPYQDEEWRAGDWVEEDPPVDIYEDEDEDEEAEEEEEDEETEEEEEDFSDYVFSIIIENREEEIIAKIYKNHDDDFWKVRVVKGEEEPLESMQFDPDMDKIDVIEHLAEIFDEVEELSMEDYKDLLDDKEEFDSEYYEKDEGSEEEETI